MDLRSSSSRYGAGIRTLHWLTVVLVITVFALSKGDRYSLYSSEADGIRRIHETLGMLLFVIVAVQLLWRLIEGTPADHPQRWMAVCARIVRFALFSLLILIPMTAILGTWLEGLPLTFPGFDLAPPIAEAHALGQIIVEIHTTLGSAILGLAGLHAGAALFHFFYLRDKVLQSMAWGR